MIFKQNIVNDKLLQKFIHKEQRLVSYTGETALRMSRSSLSDVTISSVITYELKIY